MPAAGCNHGSGRLRIEKREFRIAENGCFSARRNCRRLSLRILDAARSSHRLFLREEKPSTRSDQCDHALARQINTYAGRTQLRCWRTRIQRLQPFADVIAEHVDGDTSEVRRVTLEPRQGSF